MLHVRNVGCLGFILPWGWPKDPKQLIDVDNSLKEGIHKMKKKKKWAKLTWDVIKMVAWIFRTFQMSTFVFKNITSENRTRFNCSLTWWDDYPSSSEHISRAPIAHNFPVRKSEKAVHLWFEKMSPFSNVQALSSGHCRVIPLWMPNPCS